MLSRCPFCIFRGIVNSLCCHCCSGEAFEENKEEIKEGDEYEFTPWEGRILEVVMESMRMAGLALTVRAMATICLGGCCPQAPEDIGSLIGLHQRFPYEARMHGRLRTEGSTICASTPGACLVQISDFWGQPDLARSTCREGQRLCP